MKTLSAFSFLPSSGGFGLTAKIIVAVLVLAGGAGGVLYSLSEKNYAPQTIEFDGRTFNLLSERNGDTGEVIAVFPGKRDEAKYAAVYGVAEEYYPQPGPYNPQGGPSQPVRLFIYRVWHDSSPAPEFVRDGVFSAKAFWGAEWNSEDAPFRNDTRTLLFQVRESPGGLTRLFANDQHGNGKDLRVRGARCGASRANVFACIYYWVWERNEKYATAKEWADAEGEARLEKMFAPLADYPLSYDEELLSDMAAAVE